MNKILQEKNKQENMSLSGKEGSVREVLNVAFPLIISMAGSTVMQFINRMFLAHYSPESMAACVPGGILSLTFLCFFMGLVNYSNAFVSQYFGKGQRANISRSVWQAVWLAIASGIIIQITIPIGYFIIGHAGHDPAVAVLEKEYFFWLTVTAALPLLGNALASFYTGRGRTKYTMIANLCGNAVCVLCSWWFIFGGAGVPEMGIKGAGIASGFGALATTSVLLAFVFSSENRAKYRINKFWRPNAEMIGRMVRFGSASGIGFLLELCGFSAFVFMIGSLDKISLAASNIIASINHMSFMPIKGIGMASLTLVGKYIGMGRNDISEKAAYRSAGIAISYAVFLGILFFFLPGIFVNIFGGTAADYAEILPLARRLMGILAFAMLLDGIGIVFADSLRGGGDTKVQMIIGLGSTVFVFIPLTWAAIHYMHSVLYAWVAYGIYVAVYFMLCMMRFRSGAWKKIKLVK
jgi:MATE family multidrug resistance protein